MKKPEVKALYLDTYKSSVVAISENRLIASTIYLSDGGALWTVAEFIHEFAMGAVRAFIDGGRNQVDEPVARLERAFDGRYSDAIFLTDEEMPAVRRSIGIAIENYDALQSLGDAVGWYFELDQAYRGTLAKYGSLCAASLGREVGSVLDGIVIDARKISDGAAAAYRLAAR